MNLDEIVLGENRARIPRVIDHIQEIAIRLYQDEQSLTRRDLVKELNETISGLQLTDGYIIKALVKEAYVRSHSPKIQEAIAVCFLENNRETTVYDPNRVADVSIKIDCTGELSSGFGEFQQKTEIIDRNLQLLAEVDDIAEITETRKAIEAYVPEENLSLSGKTKVRDTLAYGQKVLQGYSSLVDHYNQAKQRNINLIADFEVLRNDLVRFRNDISQLLFDLIGEDKKEAHPELFDFSRIEHLDLEKYIKEIDLAFDNLQLKYDDFQKVHGEKIQNIKLAGEKHADRALRKLKYSRHMSRGQVKGQVAVAALGFAFDAAMNLAESWKQAEETVALINKDVEQMKLGLKKDAQNIILDLNRLLKIQNRLKMTLIPESRQFISKANHIFMTSIQNRYNELAGRWDLKRLGDENRKLAAEKVQIGFELTEREEGIGFCEESIVKYEDLLAYLQEEYNFVNDIKPKAPIEFQDKITFGRATKFYEKHLAEWERITAPTRNNYSSYVACISQERENIEGFRKDIARLKLRSNQIESLQKENTSRIEAQRQKIDVFAPQLEALKKDMWQISSALKNLMERGLQEDLLKPQQQFGRNTGMLPETFGGSQSYPTTGLSKASIDHLNDKQHATQMKIELLRFTEFIFTEDLIARMGIEDKENFIAKQKAKVRVHLTSKISKHSKLDQEQVMSLVKLGADIFASILRTQQIKAETDFLMELNTRLDQEFMKEFESSVASLRQSFEKDGQDAQMVEATLDGATTADDLLEASRILNNN